MRKDIFKGCLLVSDMDGTLINSRHKISDKNKQALRRFTENGGAFTVASGRMIDAVALFLDDLYINAPVITHNGAKIYDFSSNKTLFERSIEEERKAVIDRVYNEMPELGIEVYSNEEIYVYRECRQTQRFIGKNYKVHYSLPDYIRSEPWTKMLFIGEKDVLDKYEPIYRKSFDAGYAVRSGPNFLDIVSGESSKGNAMRLVAKLMKIPLSKTAAIGDNMNDIEMIRAAGVGFAVANAEKALLAEADFEAPDFDSDAICYVVSKLEEMIKSGGF